MIKFVFTIFLAFFVVIFFAQNSLIYYLKQRFHDDFGLENLLNSSDFSKGGKIFEAFDEFSKRASLILKNENSSDLSENRATNENENLEQNSSAEITQNALLNEQNSTLVAQNSTLNEQNSSLNEQNSSLITQNFSEQNFTLPLKNALKITENFTQNIIKNNNEMSEKIHLKKGDSVLFIGDSLMQYVGLHARRLFPLNNLKVIDLSKQSTGLIDRRNHNWQQVLESELKKSPNIKLVAVLLGANDPWGQSINGKYHDIYSSEWKEFYAKRVGAIQDAAKAHNASVLWLLMPCMEKSDFNARTRILNEIYLEKSKKYGSFVMETTPLVCENGVYNARIEVDGKRQKVRQDDGIHLNKLGSEIVARKILSRIEIE